MAAPQWLPSAVRLRGDAEHRAEPEELELMREAYLHTIFVGIETPDEEALHGMAKDQNLRLPSWKPSRS